MWWVAISHFAEILPDLLSFAKILALTVRIFRDTQILET